MPAGEEPNKSPERNGATWGVCVSIVLLRARGVRAPWLTAEVSLSSQAHCSMRENGGYTSR